MRNRSKTYWDLLKKLHSKEFIWIVPNDDNRAEDGKDLRYEFLDVTGSVVDNREWLRLGCSMFELLIALARRLSFQADGEPSFWFWHLMENINLRQYTDEFGVPESVIQQTLDIIIWRNYDSNGNGGLFPLKSTDKDQRNVELWYQMSEYLLAD